MLTPYQQARKLMSQLLTLKIIIQTINKGKN